MRSKVRNDPVMVSCDVQESYNMQKKEGKTQVSSSKDYISSFHIQCASFLIHGVCDSGIILKVSSFHIKHFILLSYQNFQMVNQK